MPSRGPDGRPLSGAALRRRRRERDAQATEPQQRATKAPRCAKPAGAQKPPAAPPRGAGLGDLPPPPRESGYHESLVWAQGLAARAAALAKNGGDPDRVRLLGQTLRELAKLKGPALDSENAVFASALYLDERIDVLADQPPERPVARGIWAWWKICELLHEVATEEDVDEGQVQHRSKALAAVGLCHPQRVFDELAERVKKASG